MNLLQLCQRFAQRTGLPVAMTVFNGSPVYLQIATLLDEVLDYLTTQHSLVQLRKQAVFTSVDGENQGVLNQIAPGFLRFCKGSFFDRARRLEVSGPLSPREWQAQKALAVSGPYSWFRVIGEDLCLLPNAGAGHELAFEYQSSYAVYDSDTGEFKQYVTKDQDLLVLPDTLLLAGLRWRWKAEKGQDYAEEFRAFETLATSYDMVDKGARALMMDGSQDSARPGIIVPSGNWIQP